MRLSMLAAVAGCLTLLSCAPSAADGGFGSAHPLAKMRAIEQAARSGDRTAVPRIVEQLDSDDPAVRSLAINALRRLTGEDHGYRDYDPPELRRAAIQRWVEAIDIHQASGNHDHHPAPMMNDDRG